MNDQPQQRIKRALDERARDLDGNTLSRLHQARAYALEEHAQSRANGFRKVLLGTGSIAALALLAALLHPQLQGEGPMPLETNGEVFEIATLNIDLEVIEELDFYEWLSLQNLEVVSEREST